VARGHRRAVVGNVRGFNYAGSWGTSGLDLWQHHDQELMAAEVARGKRYFPGWNAVRWWLSHESFQRNPQAFLANFEAGLATFAEHDLTVMPVLFNRWRDPVCDFGGVALDHIVPGFSFYGADGFAADDEPDSPAPYSTPSLFRRYLIAVVGAHASDQRILAWDLCNEPLSGDYLEKPQSRVHQAEVTWLRWCARISRLAGATQPITIGNWPSLTALQVTEPIVDFISFHPYYDPRQPGKTESAAKQDFENFLDRAVAFADNSGKELLASETVWGAVADADHVALAEYTLTQLTGRGIGFLVHALHHSLVADLHSADYGPVGAPGRLEFINADGSLRAGHGTVNRFLEASARPPGM
jgi:hypothetical protein